MLTFWWCRVPRNAKLFHISPSGLLLRFLVDSTPCWNFLGSSLLHALKNLCLYILDGMLRFQSGLIVFLAEALLQMNAFLRPWNHHLCERTQSQHRPAIWGLHTFFCFPLSSTGKSFKLANERLPSHGSSPIESPVPCTKIFLPSGIFSLQWGVWRRGVATFFWFPLPFPGPASGVSLLLWEAC